MDPVLHIVLRIMLEITWQYDPEKLRAEVVPRNADEARILLEQGNRELAAFIEQYARSDGETAMRHVTPIVLADLGLAETPGQTPGQAPGQAPAQEPFAAVLSCADARVPTELVFNQAANDLFVIRVAGNVLGSECLGTLDYAVAHLGHVRLLVVLGHTGCGAVSAAVDAFLFPDNYFDIAANPPLRSIVDSLLAGVRTGAAALERAHGQQVAQLPGYRSALVEVSVVLNAALTAAVVKRWFQDRLSDRLDVVYGVYNLQNRLAGLPAEDEEWRPGLYAPPEDAEALASLSRRLAVGRNIERLLHQSESGRMGASHGHHM
jgi:carbonic anhydrase